jgi:hypothetical protein
MKIGIMQPYFFPYTGYWQLLNAVDKYVIFDDVNFINRGWINRNRILMNGEARMINLIMSGASQNKLINEIEVSQETIHRKIFLRMIREEYKNAPYFSIAFPIVEAVMNQEERNLAKFLEYSIRKICTYLSIETEIIVSSSMPKNNSLRSQDKIIEICKILHADEYYNPIGGIKLYSFGKFASQGIGLRFLKPETAEYRQFQNQFIPNLSILDVMMFNSADEIRKMLNKFETVKE